MTTGTLKSSGVLGFGSGELASTPGYRPLNPWGRAFPKHLRDKQPRPALWQLVVMRNGKEERMGPKMPKEGVEALLDVIEKSIRCGAEKEYTAAHMVCTESDSSLKERRMIMPTRST